jgi:hypothetical protein
MLPLVVDQSAKLAPADAACLWRDKLPARADFPARPRYQVLFKRSQSGAYCILLVGIANNAHCPSSEFAGELGRFCNEGSGSISVSV